MVEVFHTKKMSTKSSVEASAKERRVKGKGKHASSTENRRMVWEKIIWPLVLGVNRSYFSLKEYHVKRDQFCQTQDTTIKGCKWCCLTIGESYTCQRKEEGGRREQLFYTLQAHSLYEEESTFGLWTSTYRN